jgi:ribosomal protein S18 acetylase RimI-like enzyme
MTKEEFRIRACDMSDLETLRNIAWQTYDDTFRHLNDPANMDAYLASAFTREKLQAELGNPHSTFFFLLSEGAVAGYLKVNDAAAQTDLHDPQSLELERIYVKRDFQGLGLGKALLGKAMEVARERKRTFVWLGVWEKNGNAIAFYKKMGFSRIGTHDFYMGSERQTDLIMKKGVERR